MKYHLGDHLGSSNVVLGGTTATSANAFVNHEEYTPYGKPASGVLQRSGIGLRGKERDEESGLYYFGARYYASWTTKWTACDPMWMKDGVSLYVYVAANPMRCIDPHGTEWKEAAPGGADTPRKEQAQDQKGLRGSRQHYYECSTVTAACCA